MIPDLKRTDIELRRNGEKVLYSNQFALVDSPRLYSAVRNSTLVPLFHAVSLHVPQRLLYIPPFMIENDGGAAFQRDMLLTRAVVVQKLTGSKINYQQLRASLLTNDNSVIKVGR